MRAALILVSAIFLHLSTNISNQTHEEREACTHTLRDVLHTEILQNTVAENSTQKGTFMVFGDAKHNGKSTLHAGGEIECKQGG